MNTQTKKDLVKEVSTRTGLDIQTVKENLQSMFDVMCEGLGADGNIEIRNFGVFKVKETPERMARNPKTGEMIQVPAKRLIHFKPGQLMKQRINKGKTAVRKPEPALAQPVVEVPPPPPREEPPKRPKPIGRDKAKTPIILLPRQIND